MSRSEQFYLPGTALQSLLDGVCESGYSLHLPTLRDGAVAFHPGEHVGLLPRGVQVEQGPGAYRFEQSDGSRYFDWANGPQALKPLLFPPSEPLWTSKRDAEGRMHFSVNSQEAEPVAVFGARPCDLAALALQEKHFMAPDDEDRYFTGRRHNMLIIAVNCAKPAATCFCASTGDGPSLNDDRVSGYDLLVDELEKGFVLQAGSPQGEAIMGRLVLQELSDEQRAELGTQQQQAVQAQQRALPQQDVHRRLLDKVQGDHWAEVAKRCLSCGNCTAVCPTCFCHREEDEAALDGSASSHVRQWDSCFSEGHSYIHGLHVRGVSAWRYRQWLTHKFAYWHDQYGRSGCVGCGRCISWCPVGIDVTEELAVLCGGED